MSDLHVRITRLDDDVELPAYAYRGDAGLDLRSNVDISIDPLERVAIPTGLCMAIPEGYAGFVMPRSGLSLGRGLSMVNTPGLIDSHYRGEIKVAAINLDPISTIKIHRGDRVAQLVILQTPVVVLEEVDELEDTDRGSGGFGSSGL